MSKGNRKNTARLLWVDREDRAVRVRLKDAIAYFGTQTQTASIVYDEDAIMHIRPYIAENILSDDQFRELSAGRPVTVNLEDIGILSTFYPNDYVLTHREYLEHLLSRILTTEHRREIVKELSKKID